MKNKKSIGYWLLEFRCQIFCLLFSVFCFLAYSAAAVGQKSPLGSLATPPDSNSNLRRQLWRAELSVAKDEKDKGTKNELKRIIEQIRSIKFESRKETFEPIIVPKGMLIDEPNEALSDTKEQEKKEIEPKLPYEPITEQTLQILKNLSQHLDKLNNSFELGETLFLSGNLKEAAMFYREALKRKGQNDVGSARDRAWILFQIGNCLRNGDPPTAIKMYRQLIIEYPNSPWKELVEARSKLLDWYLTDKPEKLIAEWKTEVRKQGPERK